MATKTENQINELINADDGILAKELEEVTSREGFIKVFAERGVQVSEEDADRFLKQGQPIDENGELDDSALEEVSGGLALWAIIAAWKGGKAVGQMLRRAYDQIRYGNANRSYSVADIVKSIISFGKAF